MDVHGDASEQFGVPDGAVFRAALSSIVFDLGRRSEASLLQDLVAAARANEGAWLWLRARCEDVGLDPLAVWARATRPITYYGAPVSRLARDPGEYQLVAVADLPARHNPHLCTHRALWDDLLGSERARQQSLLSRLRHARRLGSRGATSTPEARARVAARARFEARMRTPGMSPCGRHELGGDIVQASADAWGIVVECAAGVRPWGHAEVLRAVTGRDQPGDLSAQERLTAALLQDPVTWDGRSDQVSSGQHRICQARTAALRDLVVRIE